MFAMAMNSAKLFFAGKLFKNNGQVILQFALGSLAGIVVGVGVGQIAPIWAAALAAGGVTGLIQPLLLKNVKYA
ncbi:hypothetical protein [Bosea sp. (in: a-proteobacteria)]|jgi:hypothetical protein|uniref:hypothetical protein n=1 Tax=Bosea sp. (in: a-proteobacteria) TaxID=1871050 RepID=UPI0035693603